MRLIDADALQYSDARDMLPTGQYVTREEIDKAAEPIRHGHWILDKRGNWACEFCGNAPYHSDMYNMNYCPNCGAKLTIERDNITTHLIWNEPTVDAVEVVRCKDCKYGDPNGQYGCKCYHYKLYETHEMSLNDFCSRAERREDERK